MLSSVARNDVRCTPKSEYRSRWRHVSAMSVPPRCVNEIIQNAIRSSRLPVVMARIPSTAFWAFFDNMFRKLNRNISSVLSIFM